MTSGRENRLFVHCGMLLVCFFCHSPFSNVPNGLVVMFFDVQARIPSAPLRASVETRTRF